MVALQLEIGENIQVKRGPAGVYSMAEIVSKRPSAANPGQEEYYVHYHMSNRRLDEWIGADQVDQEWLAARDASSYKRKRDEKKNAASKGRKPKSEGHHSDDDSEDSHREAHKVKNLDVIQMGRHLVTAWYYSPYPEQLTKDRMLYICEFCLTYFKERSGLERHVLKCPLTHPPGDEIYRKDDLQFFEIDGSANRTYCQNLCLLSKLFLDHKTVDNGVELFMFYVMTTRDEFGCHMVGYFSKEKDSPEGFNLACILVLPPFQRKGYGKLLIQFSYELSKKEGKVGSPEKPLSDLGLLSYRSYWAETVLDILLNEKEKEISIKDISDMTRIKTEDLLGTLQSLGLIRSWNGTHILCVPPKLKASHLEQKKRYPVNIDPDCLHWVPVHLKN